MWVRSPTKEEPPIHPRCPYATEPAQSYVLVAAALPRSRKAPQVLLIGGAFGTNPPTTLLV